MSPVPASKIQGILTFRIENIWIADDWVGWLEGVQILRFDNFLA
jgi:hypothetical protein